jgi:drug/metabolite transporter (DMT)-like permease
VTQGEKAREAGPAPPAPGRATPVRLAVIVAALIMVVWGATPVATRLAVEDLPPLMVGVSRTVLAGLVAAPILIGLRRGPPPSSRARLLLLVSAVSGFVAFPLIFTVGQERTSAMHGGMILAALPVFTGLWAAAVSRRRPAPRWLVGCGIALLGEAGIIAFRSGSGGAEPTLGGDLLVLLAAMVVSSGYVAGAYLGRAGFRSDATTFWGVAIGAVLVAPLGAAIVAIDGWPSADATSWGAVAFLAVVTSIVGYVGWYWALTHGGIARIAPILFLQPISGLLLAAFLLDEQLTLPLLVGAAAVLAGIGITQRGTMAQRGG